MLYVILRSLTVILSKLFFRLQAFGRKNVPSEGGFILASNHVSYLDPPVLGAACPRILFFMAKEGLFKIPLFGCLIANLNTFPVKTHSGDLRAIRRAIEELKAGRALAVFPEGGRTPNGRLGKPLPGIGLLAVKAAVAIVPAFIKGSNTALPLNAKFIRPKKIKVYF